MADEGKQPMPTKKTLFSRATSLGADGERAEINMMSEEGNEGRGPGTKETEA